jgi:hypothetical protein
MMMMVVMTSRFFNPLEGFDKNDITKEREEGK